MIFVEWNPPTSIKALTVVARVRENAATVCWTYSSHDTEEYVPVADSISAVPIITTTDWHVTLVQVQGVWMEGEAAAMSWASWPSFQNTDGDMHRARWNTAGYLNAA